MSFTGKIGKEIVRAIRTEFITTLGTFITIFLAMLMPAILWVSSKNLMIVESDLKENLTVDVFLLPQTEPPVIDSLKIALSRLNIAGDILFVSSQQALFELKEMYGPELTEGLDENPLPPSFKVHLNKEIFNLDRAQFDQVMKGALDSIAAMPAVDDVLFGAAILDKLNKTIRIMKTVGLAISILVMISSIFIVANTIRITIADRKITVEIMQLVGATRAYITAPFVAIGGLLGLTGSGVALGVLYIAVKYLSKSVMQLVFLNIYEILLFLGFGILVGIIGAFVTLPKYLK